METKHLLERIPYGTRPKILLLGNGMNRAFGDSAWGDLLDNMSCEYFEKNSKYNIENLPYPLQSIVLTGDNVDEGVEYISEELSKAEVNDEYSKLLRAIVDISFDAILTTNYTYDVEKSLLSDFEAKSKQRCKFRQDTIKATKTENQFGLFRYMNIETDGVINNIWHIHGEAAKPSSMILGHYYYGKLIAQINNYMSKFISRYKGMKKGEKDFLPISWIDYFMIADVYIVGLGLDPSEMDLWWLLNCKKRHARELDSGKVYWFEPNLDTESGFSKKMLAKANDIVYVTEKVGKTQYKKYYQNLYEKICNYIN